MHILVKEPVWQIFFGLPGVLLGLVFEERPLHEHLQLAVVLTCVDCSQWYLHLQQLHRLATYVHHVVLALREFIAQLIRLELLGHIVLELVDHVPLLLEVHQRLLHTLGLRVVATAALSQPELGGLVGLILREFVPHISEFTHLV